MERYKELAALRCFTHDDMAGRLVRNFLFCLMLSRNAK